MGLRSKGLVLAMEEDSAEDDFSSNEIPETAAEVEVASSEIQEDDAVIEDISEAIEDASDDIDTLEGIQGVMEDSVEKGEGLDETAAEIAEVAIEAICARLGISKANKVMPAMESFGSSNSRVAATKIAMEGIGDVLKRAWKAIKDAFVKAWDYIVEFYKKHITFLGQLAKYADSLSAKAKAVTGSVKADADPVKSGAVLSAFNIDGKADYANAELIILNHTDLTDTISTAKSSIITLVKALLGAATDPTKFDMSKIEQLGNDFVAKVKAGSGILVGGQKLEDQASSKSGNAVTRTLLRFVASKSSKQPESAPILTTSQMKDLCDASKELIVSSQKFNTDIKTLTKIVDDLKKVADTCMNLADNLAKAAEADADAKKGMADLRKEVEGTFSLTQRIASSIPSLNFRAAKAGLTYVNESLKKYETA